MFQGVLKCIGTGYHSLAEHASLFLSNYKLLSTFLIRSLGPDETRGAPCSPFIQIRRWNLSLVARKFSRVQYVVHSHQWERSSDVGIGCYYDLSHIRQLARQTAPPHSCAVFSTLLFPRSVIRSPLNYTMEKGHRNIIISSPLPVIIPSSVLDRNLTDIWYRYCSNLLCTCLWSKYE